MLPAPFQPLAPSSLDPPSGHSIKGPPSTLIQIQNADRDLLLQLSKLQGTSHLSLLQETKGFSHHLARRAVSPSGDLLLHQSLQLRSE